MSLERHFPPDIANALQTAIDLHPELVNAIAERVIHKRYRLDTSDEHTTTVHARTHEPDTTPTQQPAPQRTTPAPKPKPAPEPKATPAPKPEPKPKPAPKPTPRLHVPTQPATPYRSRIKPREHHPPKRLNELTINGQIYITMHESRKLVAGTPLENIKIYRTGTAFLTAANRRGTIRRLHIGPTAITPTVLCHKLDIQRFIANRLQGMKDTRENSHENYITQLNRLVLDGVEWMKTTEALAIIADVPIETLTDAFSHKIKSNKLKTNLYQGLYWRSRRGELPTLTIGDRKGAFLRTIDVLPLAGTKRGILQ